MGRREEEGGITVGCHRYSLSIWIELWCRLHHREL